MLNNHLKKKDIKIQTAISDKTMAKFGKNEPDSLEILIRICKVLKYNIGDVVEIVDYERA